MQLVLSGNRIIAHGENFLPMGGTVINTETGKTYQNATVAECEGCPSDIDEVGYEYHAGAFVPCAPYGKGNGTLLVACEECASPKNSGVKLHDVAWELVGEATGDLSEALGVANVTKNIPVKFDDAPPPRLMVVVDMEATGTFRFQSGGSGNVYLYAMHNNAARFVIGGVPYVNLTNQKIRLCTELIFSEEIISTYYNEIRGHLYYYNCLTPNTVAGTSSGSFASCSADADDDGFTFPASIGLSVTSVSNTPNTLSGPYTIKLYKKNMP